MARTTVHGLIDRAGAFWPFQFFMVRAKGAGLCTGGMGTVYVVCSGGGLLPDPGFRRHSPGRSPRPASAFAIVGIHNLPRLLAACARRLAEHERWMIRSFASPWPLPTLRLSPARR